MILRVLVCALLTIIPTEAAAAEPERLPRAGAYEVQVRLEIPNVWNWTAQSTETICIADGPATNGEPPFPVLGGNNPLARCPGANVRRDGASLRFDILCEGRGAAKASAAYVLTADGFRGRIAMVMGGKNMTFTEVQVGRRIGGCDVADAGGRQSEE